MQCLGIFSAEIEHTLPGLGRLGDIVEPIGQDMRHLGADVGFMAVTSSVLELSLQHQIEVFPLFLRRVDPL